MKQCENGLQLNTTRTDTFRNQLAPLEGSTIVLTNEGLRGIQGISSSCTDIVD
jgi:hypothetical protein